MCILFLAIKQHPRFPLIIAANRDEFYARPTAPSQFWPTQPNVLAGQDLEAQGTWMGINRQGHFAALTNIRAPSQPRIETRTRGELVLEYLQDSPDSERFASRLQTNRQRYRGYNLLFGHWQDLQVYNNYSDRFETLNDGFYGLSNDALNSPWPKVSAGVSELEQQCKAMQEVEYEALFELLRNHTQAADDQLPETGMPAALEKQLSSIFINLSDYGTRSSTILTIDQQKTVSWVERIYNQQAQIDSEQRFTFQLPA